MPLGDIYTEADIPKIKEELKKKYPNGKYTFAKLDGQTYWVNDNRHIFERVGYWITAFILWSIGLSIFAISLLYDKYLDRKKMSMDKTMKRHQFWVMLRLYAVLWPLLLLIYTIIGIINVYEFLKKRFS